jgi:endoglucanase Acf2
MMVLPKTWMAVLLLAAWLPARGAPLIETFESWTDTAWGTSVEFQDGAGGSWLTVGCIVETNLVYSGQKTYRFTNGLAGGGMPFIETPPFKTNVGEVSFWYRMSDASQGMYYVQYHTALGPYTPFPGVAQIQGSNTNWLKWSYTFTDPSWATNRIQIQISRNGNGSGLIIDDVYIADYSTNVIVTPPSFATNIPAGFVTPPTNIYVTTNVAPPYPTSEFWSSMLHVRNSGMMPARPLLYYAKGWALELGYPFCGAVSNSDYIRGFFVKDFDISATGGSFPAKPSGEARVDGWGDFHVRARIGADASHITATLAHGSPFAFLRFEDCAPRINCWTGYLVEAVNTNASYLVIRTRQHRSYAAYTNHFAFFAASGTTWNTTSTNQIVPNLPPGQSFLAVAALPSHSSGYASNELMALLPHAFAFITNTRVDFAYVRSNATIRSTFSADVESMQGGQTTTLLGLLPHHWKNASATTVPALTYDSSKGDLRTAATNSFTSTIHFHGIVPQFPAPSNAGWTQSVFSSLANTIAAPNADTDTYAKGKDLERLARVLPALDACGLTNRRNTVLSDLKGELDAWFTYTEGEPSRFFAYDPRWGALCGYNESFSSVALMNDQHFHYGMYVYSAAMAALFDYNWGTNAAPVVEKIIRTYNNPSRDTSGPQPLPWLRYFDPWEGHCWASGLGGVARTGPSDEQLYGGETAEASADGPDEESCSEALNAWAAMYLWGLVMGKDEFIDMGAIGYAIEAEAVREYWYDADGTNHKPGYTKTMVSRVFGNKLDPYTWFSAEMQHAWGIQYILTGPHMTYQGYFKPYRITDYDYFKANNPGGVGGISDGWKDIHWMYRCFFEPAQVLAEHSTNTVTDGGNTRANLYYWIHAMNSLGEVNTNLVSDWPGLVVMNNNGTNRLVAFAGGVVTARVFHAASGVAAGTWVLTNAGTKVLLGSDDADGDGLATDVEVGFGSDFSVADTDNDGATDWEEHFTATGPSDAASYFRLLGFGGTNVVFPGNTGRTYVVRGYANAADLAAGVNGSNLLTTSSGTGIVVRGISLPAWTNGLITITVQ